MTLFKVYFLEEIYCKCFLGGKNGRRYYSNYFYCLIYNNVKAIKNIEFLLNNFVDSGETFNYF